MWQFLQSKLAGVIITGLLFGSSYLLGYNRGISNCELRYKEAMLKSEQDKEQQIRHWQEVNNSTELNYHNQKESNLFLFQKLKNENQNIKDNLNNCQLDNHRLRIIYRAAKVPLSNAARRVGTESNGIATDNLRPMTCADLQATNLACAARYAACYNGYTKLWGWAHGIAK